MLFDRHLKSCFWQIWKRCFLTNMTAMLCSLSVFSVSISTCQEWKLLQFFWPLEIFEEEADNWSTFYRVRTAVWVPPIFFFSISLVNSQTVHYATLLSELKTQDRILKIWFGKAKFLMKLSQPEDDPRRWPPLGQLTFISAPFPVAWNREAASWWPHAWTGSPSHFQKHVNLGDPMPGQLTLPPLGITPACLPLPWSKYCLVCDDVTRILWILSVH